MPYHQEPDVTPSETTATVSSKGQVVIPSEVRRRLGLTQGSVLRFVLDGDSVRLFAAGGDVRKLKGRLPAPPRPVSLQDMDDAIAQRRAGAGRA
jgi:antitoxin PrlF